MPKHREIPQPQKKICPQDGAQYEDFCMAYGCENQDGSGGCKAVQPRECINSTEHKCNKTKMPCKIWCDGKCAKCPISANKEHPQ
ncbi:Uncharacterised protein [uncultured archaeon]|nr:Uncharacterised protein [uncultured archaeon]